MLEAKLPAFLPKDRGAAPRSVAPIEQLSVAIHAQADGTRAFADGGTVPSTNPVTGRPVRFAVAGHTVHWTVGPTPVADAGTLLSCLQHICADRGTWRDDPRHPGAKRPMSVVIEPHAGTYYDDVAATVDIVRAAGFDEVDFGAGAGPR